MKIIGSKRLRLLAVIVAFAVIAEGFMVSVGSISSYGNRLSKQSESSEDQRIAAEISNMTGVQIEQILKLKATGKSWNDILDSLKYTNGNTRSDSKAKRSQVLLESGLGEDAVARLKSEGYSEKDIMNAKLLVERTALQIKQLAEEPLQKVPGLPSALSGSSSNNEQEAFLTELRSVADHFDLEGAVRLMLNLKNEFGSNEAVLDEYLFALESGLNLEDYLRDKTQYLKAKEQKNIERVGKPSITLTELERRLLDRIRQDNEAQRDSLSIKANDSKLSKPDEATNNPLPEVPTPKVRDVRPVNPADTIKEELKKINPNVPTLK